MKHLLVVLLVVSGVCVGDKSDPEKICADLHDVGKAIMELRQNGASLPEVMQILNNTEGGAGGIRNAYKKIIVSAYESPRHHTERMKARAAVDFANELYIGCYKEAG